MARRNLLTILFLSVMLIACSSDDNMNGNDVPDHVVEEVMEKMLGTYRIHKYRINSDEYWGNVNQEDYRYMRFNHTHTDEGSIPTAHFNLPDNRSLERDEFFVNNQYNVILKDTRIMISIPERYKGDTLSIRLMYPSNRVIEYHVTKK